MSICLVLVLLAAINAICSQPTDDWVLKKDQDLFYPTFLASEGFVRSFLINVCFASISTAATAFQNVDYTSFWLIRDPLLAIFLALSLGFVLSFLLRSNSNEPVSNRPRRIAWLCGLTLGLFAFSVWTTFQPQLNLTTKSDHSLKDQDGKKNSHEGN